ncbi:6,7-dimethyl-8-ribityllumazine synthase [Microvirga alba]|uniref:6,7-dimethyl-8-ribityllumazine synthase n=1 Tax=Microvirga alba TaxID=2791025 RepID=UPI002D218B9A|nr:6,7-dimethyl-8-ribityllumazine synthase [Microvirga alba]
MDQFTEQQQTRSAAGKSHQTRIAFVQSGWHKDIVDRCRDAFVAAMTDGGVDRQSIDLYEVPGAFEIPLLAKRLAKSGRYDAIVASGLVVDGGIYRHEFVADAVISGLMQIQLETDVPVLSAVLTPQHFHEHDTHREFFTSHFDVKGREAAAACLAVTSASYAQPVRS